MKLVKSFRRGGESGGGGSKCSEEGCRKDDDGGGEDHGRVFGNIASSTLTPFFIGFMFIEELRGRADGKENRPLVAGTSLRVW